jgi:glycosyltransferase involved in cell wall biosynthesis
MSKKILLLIPNFGFGGAQRVFSDHSKLFSEEYTVEECVFNENFSNTYKTENLVHNLNVEAGKSFFDKAHSFYQRVSRLKEIKRKQHYDVSISHLEGADYVNVLSRQSEKTILVIHGSKVADENITGILGWLRKKILLPLLYKKADTIVTVSDGIKKELEEEFHLPPSKIFSIPNYFDINQIVKLSKEDTDLSVLSLKKENQLILYSGRFAKQKNLLPLFKIFKNLQDSSPKVKLLLLGDGELKQELYNECKRLNLSYFNNENPFNENYDVYFLGYKSNPFPYIRACDIFIMTSKWEGFPMALCEAMAIGTCVVASDCPTGPRQILWGSHNEFKTTNTGVLLPIPTADNKENLSLWATKLNELLKDDSLREIYKVNAYKRSLDFEREKVIIQWKSLITS